MSVNIPPLFRGEVLIPPGERNELVRSTTEILKRLVVWDEQSSHFRARPNQPDLCILPLRSGPIAAAGLFAFTEKHGLPVPPCLPVPGIGREVYDAYELAHIRSERMLRQQPEEFERLKAIDIERFGPERSFLCWVERVTSALSGDDDFPFGNITFLDVSFGADDDVVGGYYRFMDAQLSEYAPPNASRSARDSIRTHPAVCSALQTKGTARVMLIDDVCATGETNGVHAYKVLKGLSGIGITFSPRESMFVFSSHGQWLHNIQDYSMAGKALPKLPHDIIHEFLRGTSIGSSYVPEGFIWFEDKPFDTPEAIEGFVRFHADGADLLGKLQKHYGISSRDELIAQLLGLAAKLRTAIIAAVDEAEAVIFENLRQPG